MFDGKWGVEVKLLKRELLRIFHKISFQWGLFYTLQQRDHTFFKSKGWNQAHDVVITHSKCFDNFYHFCVHPKGILSCVNLISTSNVWLLGFFKGSYCSFKRVAMVGIYIFVRSSFLWSFN